MKLTPVYIDVESFWSADHTLSKMTNIEYVMHPETEIISMAIKVKDYPTDVIFGETEIAKALKSLDWSDKMAIGHNMSGFDSLILSWRFGINPALWGCTLAMARSEHNATVGGSLAKLVQHYEIGVKNNAALLNTKGRHLKDFTQEEVKAMAIYNKDDTDQCAQLFKKLAKGFPKEELLQIDLTTRMLTEPQFKLDTEVLKTALAAEKEAKQKALLDLYDQLVDKTEQVVTALEDGPTPEEFVRATLASSARFGALLAERGVEVPMKPSPSDPTSKCRTLDHRSAH